MCSVTRIGGGKDVDEKSAGTTVERQDADRPCMEGQCSELRQVSGGPQVPITIWDDYSARSAFLN